MLPSSRISPLTSPGFLKATVSATKAPNEFPTRKIGLSGCTFTASSRRKTAAVWFFRLILPGATERPKPGRSRAKTLYPVELSKGIRWRQESASSPRPWISISTGVAPLFSESLFDGTAS